MQLFVTCSAWFERENMKFVECKLVFLEVQYCPVSGIALDFSAVEVMLHSFTVMCDPIAETQALAFIFTVILVFPVHDIQCNNILSVAALIIVSRVWIFQRWT
jgi:hypothetical protein